MTIQNLPANFRNYKYIVTRVCGGEHWFYTMWNDRDAANENALMFKGVVWDVDCIQ